MNQLTTLTRGAICCALFALSSTVANAAQEGTPMPAPAQKPEVEKPKPDEKPELTFDDFAPEQDAQALAQQEMVELFARVERRLRLIDSMLLDASAGDTSALDELAASGIDDLLESAPETPEGEENQVTCDNVDARLGQSAGQGRQAVQEIDDIITIAKSLPSECKSGAPMPGQKPKPGGSPVDQPQGTRERSQGPEKPQEQEGPKPGDKPGEQPGEKKPGGEDPKDNKGSDEDASNKPAQKTPASETGAPPQVTDQRDQWGDLPVHVRDVFRAEGGPGMPAQYRDWIDAYYRRLNSRASD
ncbi:MAG: hypothetical protein ACI8QZ_000413 [Chlamydiales bacterium]|jgi:hypothetical protein